MKTFFALLLGVAIGFLYLHSVEKKIGGGSQPTTWDIGSDETTTLELPRVLGGENSRSDIILPVTLINRLTNLVKIVDLQPSCGCMTANITLPLVLQENQSATFELHVSFARTAVGKIEQSLLLKMTDGGLRRLQIKGIKLSDEGMLPFPPALDLGYSVAEQSRDVDVLGSPAALHALSASGDYLTLQWQGDLENLRDEQMARFGLKRKRLHLSLDRSALELAAGQRQEVSEISWWTGGQKIGQTQIFWSTMTSSIVTREVMLGRIVGRQPVKLPVPALSVEKYRYVPKGDFTITPVRDGLELTLSNPQPGLATGTVDLIEKSSGGKVGVLSWSAFVDPTSERQD